MPKRLRRRKALLHCSFYTEHGCGRLHQLGPDLLRHTDEPPGAFPRSSSMAWANWSSRSPVRLYSRTEPRASAFVREGMSIWERNRRNFSADTFSYSSAHGQSRHRYTRAACSCPADGRNAPALLRFPFPTAEASGHIRHFQNTSTCRKGGRMPSGCPYNPYPFSAGRFRLELKSRPQRFQRLDIDQ